MLKFVAMIAVAGLLGGCAAPVPAAAPAVKPSLVLGPQVLAGDAPVAAGVPAAPPASAAGAAKATLLSPDDGLPRSGEWTVSWTFGDQTVTETVDLAFRPDGSVVVADFDQPHATPAAWTAEAVAFEGHVHREVTQNLVSSRERFHLTKVSDVELRGTRAVRVNFRWVTHEARATFNRSLTKGGAGHGA